MDAVPFRWFGVAFEKREKEKHCEREIPLIN